MKIKETISYEKYRQTGGISYAKLTDGFTNYELSGPKHASHTVVLIHGGTIPLNIWDAQMEAMRASGFRILRYDQYGRGFSERPNTQYSRTLFTRQLKELLEYLHIQKVDIVGPSFGGAIGVSFSAQYSELVNTLVLISPALNVINSDSPLSLPIRISRIPLIGPLFFKIFVKKALISRGLALVKGGENPECESIFLNQFKCIGTASGLYSMLISDAYEDYQPLTRTAGSKIGRILLLRGKEDKEITPAMIRQTREIGRAHV